MNIDGFNLITDPVNKVIWGNAHFKNYIDELKCNFPLDFVLISHSHKDHFDPKALSDLEARAFVIPRGSFRLFPRDKDTVVFEMKPWESFELQGIKISSLPALHLSWLHPYPIFTFSLSYLVEFKGLSIYFAGDTGLSGTLFRKIGQRYRIDVAFLPVGPDLPLLRWYHLGAKDALRAFKLLRAKVFIPIHWGVIKGTSGDSSRTVRKLLKLSPPSMKVLNVGEVISWEELLRGA